MHPQSGRLRLYAICSDCYLLGLRSDGKIAQADQGCSKRLYHVEDHQKENWRIKRYLTYIYLLYFLDSESLSILRGFAGWSALFVICKQQSQGSSCRGPYFMVLKSMLPGLRLATHLGLSESSLVAQVFLLFVICHSLVQ